MFRRIILCVVLALFAPYPLVKAQSSVGIQPFGTYASDFDQINVGTLAIHIDIPLYVRKGRGEGTDSGFHLLYDDGTWSWNGPGVGVGQVKGADTVHTCPKVGSTTDSGIYTAWGWSYADETGYVHAFAGSTIQNQCVLTINQNEYPTSSLSEYANDGSGYYLSATGGAASITTPSGQVLARVGSNGQISSGVDSNGNTGAVNGFSVGCNSSVSICPTTSSLSNGDTVDTFLNLSGAVQTPASGVATSVTPTVLQYKDTGGNIQSITVTYVVYSLTLTFQTKQVSIKPLIDSITYPDGTLYKFTYFPSPTVSGAVTPFLQGVTLPTGGTITYDYSNPNNSGCGFYPESFTEYSSLTRATPDGPTTYATTATAKTSPNNLGECYITTSQTTITKPDQSSELVNFVGTNESGTTSGPTTYETYHAWYSTSNTLIQSTLRCYNGQASSCISTPVTPPITSLGVSRTTGSGLTDEKITYYNANALPTEVDEYDFGSSSPNRKTITTYASLGYVQDKPSTVTVQGGSSNPLAKTTYGYDEYTLTPTSGLPGHSAVTTQRGNLTSVHRWLLNTTGGTVDTHFQYDDAGQMLASERPILSGSTNGDWTYFGLDTATDSCVISTTPPTPSSGVSQATSAGCDPYNGLATSMTDANGVATVTSYDLMLRPNGSTTTTQTGVLAASSTRTYSGSSLPEVITSTVTASPSPSEVKVQTLDGLGRVVTEVMPSGATITTSYDSNGRKKSVSNPYDSITDLTYGLTSYTYDALNRQTIMKEPDGNLVQLCYDGLATTAQTNCDSNVSSQKADSWVDYSDEAGRHWQRVIDGFGRLIALMELGTSANPISFETDYTYDTLDDLLSVNQLGASTDSPRARSFTYDSLSRLLTSTNPETGTICYGLWSGGSCTGGYDANGNLLYKTDTRGVSTNYSYDSLNRMLSKTYSGVPASVASTPPSTFVYDINAGTAVPNAVGRLVSEYTGPAGAPVTQRSIIQYDAVGRIQQETQCATTAGCSGTPYGFQYFYDLAGNMTYSNNGVSTTGIGLNYTYDGAARQQTVTSTWSDATHPATLFGPPSSGAQYNPADGLIAASLGISSSSQQPAYTLQRTYDNRFRTVSETDTGTNIVTTPATGSTGSIGVSGAELVIASTSSTGTITITGSPGSYQVCISAGGVTNCPSLIFTPNTFVMIDGPGGRFTAVASSAAGTTAAGVASTLTTALNGSGSPVAATVNGSVITLTSNTTGSSSDYMVYVSNVNESGPGATALAGGSGGTSTPSTGTVTVTGAPGSYQVCISAGGVTNCPSVVFTPNTFVMIDGPAGRFTASASSASGTTAASLASALTTTLNGSASPVTATVNGGVITLTSVATGAATNYMVYVSNRNESGPGGTALTGGAGGVPTYDTGTVTVSINGATASYTWGSSDTGATVASGLEAAIMRADSGVLGATLSGATLNLASTQTGASTNWAISCTVTDSNSTLFPTPSFAEVCNGMTGGTDPVSGGAQAVYNYSLGYYSNSNVQTVSDSVMGNWTYTYDNLNRALTGQASANPQTGFAPYGTGLLSWSYDSFGNYEGQKLTGNTTAIVNQGTYLYTGHSLLNGAMGTGTPTNQIDDDCYDASGNLIGVGGGCSTYTYDAEGRLALVVATTTQYVYDAEGRRVAKLNGTTVANQYLLGLSGEQVSELDGNGNWLHTNTYNDGRLLATYDNVGLHFHFTDWLGSRRVQANASTGVIDETCQSLPFGDSFNCSGPGPDATELHFTGKERDTESGLDYFGARYYASNMGRFMSPDYSDGPDPVPFGDLANPQSLDLYSYVGNNPVDGVDDDGHLSCFGQSSTSLASCIGNFFRNLFGGGGDNSSPPPPTPPPTPPPGVPEGGPGTVTGPLIEAQNAARVNPHFQPIPGGSTFCNMASCYIGQHVGSNMGPLMTNGVPNLANVDASTLAHSGAYHRVGPAEAQRLANMGKVVYGVYKETGHGHIVTVRPNNGPYTGSGTPSTGPNDPIINDIGRHIGVYPLSQQPSAGFRNGVIFYAPNQ